MNDLTGNITDIMSVTSEITPPNRRRKGVLDGYAIHKLKVGQSRLIPEKDVTAIRHLIYTAHHLSTMRFTTKKMDDGNYRIWRIA